MSAYPEDDRPGQGDGRRSSGRRRMPRRKFWAIIGSAIALALILVGGTASLYQHTHNAGEGQEQSLIVDKNKIGIALSTCLQKSSVGAQTAELQTQSVLNIMTSALAARYAGTTNGQPAPGTTALPNDTRLILALQGGYPNVDVSTWKALLVVVTTCQDDIADAQNKLQGDAGTFATWATTGGVITHFWQDKFPDGNLYVTDATGQTLYGEAALKAMRDPVLLGSARSANNSGVMPQQTLPGYSPPPASLGRPNSVAATLAPAA